MNSAKQNKFSNSGCIPKINTDVTDTSHTDPSKYSIRMKVNSIKVLLKFDLLNWLKHVITPHFLKCIRNKRREQKLPFDRNNHGR